jgi:enamine deaminase RidA (YjgF/YER057c/UK114 family)
MFARDPAMLRQAGLLGCPAVTRGHGRPPPNPAIVRLEKESVGFGVPEGVPSPLAGYSPAIRRGDWIFLAGEIAVDWKGDYESSVHLGEPSALAKEARINPYVWYGSEIEKQTEYTLWKLSKIAESAGTTLAHTVKADVYIGDPSDYEGMEKVWKRWFPENPPARCQSWIEMRHCAADQPPIRSAGPGCKGGAGAGGTALRL